MYMNSCNVTMFMVSSQPGNPGKPGEIVLLFTKCLKSGEIREFDLPIRESGQSVIDSFSNFPPPRRHG